MRFCSYQPNKCLPRITATRTNCHTDDLIASSSDVIPSFPLGSGIACAHHQARYLLEESANIVEITKTNINWGVMLLEFLLWKVNLNILTGLICGIFGVKVNSDAPMWNDDDIGHCVSASIKTRSLIKAALFQTNVSHIFGGNKNWSDE